VEIAQDAPTDFAQSLSPAARIAYTILILATLGICYFSHLGALGFVGPDEPRYAWIARDMAETGDWVTPRLYGKAWFEKPPLYYWSAALSFKLFGVSEVAARLPSAIAALFATLALAWLAWRVYGPEIARWLLLLLPTSVAMIGFSHAASTDMLFSTTLILALVCAAIMLRLVPNRSASSSSFASLTSSTSLISILFGFFLGLAVLAKGPAAIVLLGGAVFFWALFTKLWRDAFRLFHPAALAAFFFTALPWYMVCARRNPDFFRVFIIEHNFRRYLTPEFQHIQPFWYYAVVLLVALLPWTALFLWSLISGTLRLWRTREISDATLLLLCWSAFCILFFSISKSKLPGYILPAIPIIELLVFRICRILAAGKSKSLSTTVFVTALLFSAGYVLVMVFPNRMVGLNFPAGVAAGWILAALATANWLLGVRLWRSQKFSGDIWSACAVLAILAAAFAAPKFVPTFFIGDPSGKSIAEELAKLRVPVTELSAHRMNRGRRYSLSFYLHREIPEWDSLQPSEGYVLERGQIVSLVYSRQLIINREPRELGNTGYFLYEIRSRSVGAATGSGEVK